MEINFVLPENYTRRHFETTLILSNIKRCYENPTECLNEVCHRYNEKLKDKDYCYLWRIEKLVNEQYQYWPTMKKHYPALWVEFKELAKKRREAMQERRRLIQEQIERSMIDYMRLSEIDEKDCFKA